MKNNQIESAGIIPLLKEKGEWKVFLIQYRDHVEYWGCPKGHLKTDEAPEAAAAREVYEETGLKINRLIQEDPLLEEFDWVKDGVLLHKRILFYMALVEGEIHLQNEEIIDGQWFSLSEAIQKIIFPEGKETLKQARKILQKKDWENYFQNTLNLSEPRKTLSLAQKYFLGENITTGCAADLGAGTGRDTLFLIQQGWKVLAIDAEQLSIDIILKKVDASARDRLEVKVIPFAEMVLPAGLDLVNAGYSLPFCKPGEFAKCWRKIIESLKIGGRFSGQFFGEKDEWAVNPDLTIYHYEDLLKLFKDHFVIEYTQIEEGLMPGADEQMKHWHLYHVVAKKIR